MISRPAAEIAFAGVTGLFGAVVAFGATEFGVGWSPSGPQPGTFPFAIGCILVAASLFNMAAAALRRRPDVPLFMTAAQGAAVLRFCLPMLGFVALAVYLGLYVATALYMIGVMRLQGGYPLWHAAAVGLGMPLALFWILEKGFRVALLKGPLEAALGF